MPQSFFLRVAYLLAQDDVLTALRAEDVPAKTTMMSPSHYRQKFFPAVETMSNITVLFPLFFGL